MPQADDSARSGISVVRTSAIVIALNFATGALIAQLLGPSGRGELTAVLTIGQTVGWVFAMGCQQAIVYTISKNDAAADDVFASWLVLLVPFSIAGIVAGWLIAPLLLAEQSQQTVELARIWLATVPLVILSEAMLGMLTADRNFRQFNINRILLSGVTLAVYLAFWIGGDFSVEHCLIGTLVAWIVVNASAGFVVHRQHGLGRPSRSIMTSGLSYGFRAHGANLGNLVSVRMDLLVLPAVLAAASVGLYAVSASIATIVVAMTNAIGVVVLPIAARRGSESPQFVVAAAQATFAFGAVLAAGIAVASYWLIPLVYGNDFKASYEPLLILLPGAVVLSTSAVVIAGLNAIGRPGTGALAQLLGAAVTAIGLLLFLGSGGITAAAIVSSSAYAIAFLAATVAFVKRTQLTSGDLFDTKIARAAIASRLRERRAS